MTQCSVAAGLGLALRRDPQRLGHQHPRPRRRASSRRCRRLLAEHGLQVSSIGSPIGKIFVDEDFEPHLERLRHAADVATTGSARRTSGSSRSSSDRATTPRTTATRCSAGCGRSPTSAEAAGRDPGAREREGHLRRHPGPLPRHRRVGRLAEPAGGLGPGQLRPGRRPPFTDGYALLRPHLEYIQIKDALAADGDGDGRRRRATASCVETIRALRDDGFDGFFSLEPHLGDAARARRLLRPDAVRPGAHAPSPTPARTKGSSTHEQRCSRPNDRPTFAHRRRRGHRQAPRRGDDRARPTGSSWSPSSTSTCRAPRPLAAERGGTAVRLAWPRPWPRARSTSSSVCTPTGAARRASPSRRCGRQARASSRSRPRSPSSKHRRDHRGASASRGHARSRSSRSTGSTRPPTSPSPRSRPASSAG